MDDEGNAMVLVVVFVLLDDVIDVFECCSSEVDKMGGEDGISGSEILRWRRCRLLRFATLDIFFKLIRPLMGL